MDAFCTPVGTIAWILLMMVLESPVQRPVLQEVVFALLSYLFHSLTNVMRRVGRRNGWEASVSAQGSLTEHAGDVGLCG